jgi:PAS domain S-box-containing protein
MRSLPRRFSAVKFRSTPLRKRYVKKNGEIIWINLTGSVVHDKDGAPIYGLAMIEDITERKHA